MALKQAHDSINRGISQRVQFCRGAVLYWMRQPDDRRIEAQRIALRFGRIGERFGDNIDGGDAAPIEISNVVQTARCARASI